MGLDVRGKIVVGVPVSHSDFWTRTGAGTVHRCECGHGRNAAEKFCPEDGTRVIESVAEVPTSGYAQYAQQAGRSPADLWVEFATWHDESWKRENAGLPCVQRVPALNDHAYKDVPLAFGVRILQTESNRGGGDDYQRAASLTLGAIAKVMDAMRITAAEVGIHDREPQVFFVVNFSY